jgi:CRP-like cAMP-binding protein
MEKDLVDHIQNIAFLTDEQLSLALIYFKPSSHAKGELLVKEGNFCNHMNYVVKGCLRIYFIKEDGQEATRHLAFEQQFATGLASFIRN